MRSSDCCNYAVRCITPPGTLPSWRLEEEPFPWEHFSLYSLAGGQGSLIPPSDTKGPCWIRLALPTFAVHPRALTSGLQAPKRSHGAGHVHRWQGQLQHVHGNRWALNRRGGGEIITRADSFGVGFKQMGIWSGNWLQLWG